MINHYKCQLTMIILATILMSMINVNGLAIRGSSLITSFWWPRPRGGNRGWDPPPRAAQLDEHSASLTHLRVRTESQDGTVGRHGAVCQWRTPKCLMNCGSNVGAMGATTGEQRVGEQPMENPMSNLLASGERLNWGLGLKKHRFFRCG